MNNKLLIAAGYAILLLIGGGSHAESAAQRAVDQTSQDQMVQEGPIKIDIQTPRNYGYVLGDRITLTAQISTPLFYQLETSFLPKPGPVNEWLQLIAATPAEAAPGYDFAVAITYQVFKSVPVTTELTLPPLPLRFQHRGDSLTETVPAWTFSYTPLIPGNKPDDQLKPEPELPPKPMETARLTRKLSYLITAISVLVLYIVWFYGKIPFLERYSGAFGKACRTLKRLKQQAPSQETRLKALQCFHHALNELAGETVLAAQLPTFFQQFPTFAPLREKTENLFEVSQQVFFSGNDETQASFSIEQIESLCLRYRKLERSFRWP